MTYSPIHDNGQASRQSYLEIPLATVANLPEEPSLPVYNDKNDVIGRRYAQLVYLINDPGGSGGVSSVNVTNTKIVTEPLVYNTVVEEELDGTGAVVATYIGESYTTATGSAIWRCKKVSVVTVGTLRTTTIKYAAAGAFTNDISSGMAALTYT